jgi:hypothetical protein
MEEEAYDYMLFFVLFYRLFQAKQLKLQLHSFI